jgi:hypothetical protein
MDLNRICGRTSALLALALGFAFAAPHASASSLSTVAPVVQVSVTGGYDYYTFEGEATAKPDGSLGISSVGESAGDFRCEWDLTVDPDPLIMGTFTLTSLAPTDQAYTMIATLAIAPIASPTAMSGYVGDVKVTEATATPSLRPAAPHPSTRRWSTTVRRASRAWSADSSCRPAAARVLPTRSRRSPGPSPAARSATTCRSPCA